MFDSKLGQRVPGVFLVLIGVGFTALTWHDALTQGRHRPAAAVLFPALLATGLALAVFPMDRGRLRAAYAAGRQRGWSRTPAVWDTAVAGGVLAGLLNWLLLAHL